MKASRQPRFARSLTAAYALIAASALGALSLHTSSQAQTTPAAQSARPTLGGSKALVIGHRGASGYLPEHTLESYMRAIELGADFIEPDLVATKDGQLIARHEPNITNTTDVADRPEFAGRKTSKTVDGVVETGWFASDFTLAEIKTLRAKQPMTERDQSHNGRYQIPTFREILDLALDQSIKLKRDIGVYPETKHSTYHVALDLPLEDRLLTILRSYGYTEKKSPVIIQSFEVSNLKYLRSKTQVRLVQLIDGDGVDKDGQVTLDVPSDKPYDFTVAKDSRNYKDMLTPAGLAQIKTYADGIGPWKPYILAGKFIDANNDGKPDDLNGDGVIDERDRILLQPTSLVKDAHAAGLFVHAFTFRNEPRRLASDYKGDPKAEYKRFFDLGVDGLFSDFPDAARTARDE